MTSLCRSQLTRLFYLFVLFMGNKESQQTKDFDIEISHPRFVRSKIISRDGEKYLQTSQAIEEKQYEKWQAALAKFNHIPDSLLLPKTYSFSRTGLCGNTGTLQINYDNYPYLLFEEIYNRRGLKGRFSEPELWGLLLALSDGRREAEAAGEGLGDIRPKNIFLNEQGRIKVANSLSWPLESTNIQKAFDKVPTYLAPEDLDSIAKGEAIDIPSDPSEAFSIGLTVLSAGNLADYEGLYDLQQDNSINQASLNEALGAWAFNPVYSEILRGTVLLLLNVHPERRLNCRELYDLLKDHAEAIQKKDNFVIDNAPVKMHQEIQHLRSTLAQQPSPYQPDQ